MNFLYMNSCENKKRPTLLKRRNTVCRKRLSFTFEQVDVEPILRREIVLTPASRAAKKISRRVRKVRFRPKGTVIDITPLSDKPEGRIRMPVSPGDEEQKNCCDQEEKLKYENYDSNLPLELSLSAVFFANTRDKTAMVKQKFVSTTSYSNFSLSERCSDDIKQITELLLEPATPNVIKLWNLEESEAYELGQKCSENLTRKSSELWSSLFAPRAIFEIFNNSSRVHTWLAEWAKRMSTQKPEIIPSAKRKRAIFSYENEDDEDYECSNHELPNPLIISGPTGTGKTATVYCAAEANKMRVLEFSPCERRNGFALHKKLSGAIESHYIYSNTNAKRKIADIRQLFSPKLDGSNNSFNSVVHKFSIVLIDDCDILYSSDDSFWSTLKCIFDEAKIPIILTCTNYDYVKKKLNVKLSSSESIQYNNSFITRFSRHLIPWIAGFTGKLLTSKWLRSLIESKRTDARAVLNTLHFQLGSGRLEANEGNTQNFVSLKQHARTVYALAELDAAYGVDSASCTVTWRAKETADFDYRPELRPAYQLGKSQRLSAFQCADLMEALNPFICLQEISSLFSADFYSHQPLKVLKDAWMRSWSHNAILFSWRSVGTDYMPCLRAIDAKFQRESSKRVNALPSDSSTRRSKRTMERAQHPFDEINPATCESIDRIGGLSLSIGMYSFSNTTQSLY